MFQSAAAATVKAEVPKVEPAKDSKPAPVAAATAVSVQGNVSVQGKKGEAKTSHTKVEPPTRQQEAVKRLSCVFSVHSGCVLWSLC